MNVNRQLANGDDNDADTLIDETNETFSNVATATSAVTEPAFPEVVNAAAAPSPHRGAGGKYQTLPHGGNDDFGLGGNPAQRASGGELLARQLYCLMFVLVGDPTAAGGETIPNFPYPDGFTNDPAVRGRYAAERLAQWAVNVVDARDSDAICTRLRYDPFPLDGFDLTAAAANVVWGAERAEVEISETLAFHDKRLRRSLHTPSDTSGSGDEEGSVVPRRPTAIWISFVSPKDRRSSNFVRCGRLPVFRVPSRVFERAFRKSYTTEGT